MTETEVIDSPATGTETHWFDEKYPSLKEHSTFFKRYNTEEDSHKAHIEAKQALSKPYNLPKSLDGLSDEQKMEFHAGVAKLRGVPGTADKYVLNRPEDIPAEMFSDERDNKLKELAKKRDVTNETLQEFYDLHNQIVKEAYQKKQEQNETSSKECLKTLSELWGKDNDENHVLCKRYLRTLVNPEWTNTPDENKDEKWIDFTNKIYDSQVGNNPVIMQAVLQAAKSTIAEGKTLPGVTSKKESEPSTDKEKWEKKYPKSTYPG